MSLPICQIESRSVSHSRARILKHRPVTGYTVTWKESNKVERVIRGDAEGIVHLHGSFNDPESVVLGIRSYERVLGDEHTQAMLRALVSVHRLGNNDGAACFEKCAITALVK